MIAPCADLCPFLACGPCPYKAATTGTPTLDSATLHEEAPASDELPGHDPNNNPDRMSPS